ncbi:MAG: hypothetical protein GF398_10010 [Chitinivibrionales bacterium]|nr:hypothetical protein [Chitinivibrionales bacterium]
MTKNEILSMLNAMIAESKTAVLATVEHNRPHLRWMTPAMLPDHPESIFMLSSPHLAKVAQALTNPDVEMLFQTKALHKVITVEGNLIVHTNAALHSEILEAAAARLRVLWKMNADLHDLVALELVIRKAVYTQPMKGEKTIVTFAEE